MFEPGYFAKYWIEDLGQQKTVLKELGAKFEGSRETKDKYYKLEKQSCERRYLRIRRKKETGEITYICALSDNRLKVWQSKVDEPEVMEEIFKNIAMELDVEVEKKRDIYSLSDCHIILDYVKNLGNFIEIQAVDEINLDKVAKDLELEGRCRIVGKGYPDMLKEKRAGTFRYPDFMGFCL